MHCNPSSKSGKTKASRNTSMPGKGMPYPMPMTPKGGKKGGGKKGGGKKGKPIK